MSERVIHKERLEAIRDWQMPKYSTGVHVSRDETAQMASRVLVSEAENANLRRAIAESIRWIDDQPYDRDGGVAVLHLVGRLLAALNQGASG